jgi:hypothetical protein
MATTYTYYRQDNGVDSWIAVETDGDRQVISKYMVYDDPNKKETIRNFEKLSTEDIATFKGLIGVTSGGSTTIVANEGILVKEIPSGGYSIGIDFDTIRTGTSGYTGTVPVFDGKYTSFLDFQDGLLISVTSNTRE